MTSKETLISLYESMIRQRTLEEKVVELYKKGLIPGLAHSYIGQEAIAAGVCGALKKEDLIVSNHRGHGHSVAKGVPEQTILSELMGKNAGMCLGLGGSMHSTDLNAGVVFSTAIVGGGIPLSVGVALAMKMDHKQNCVACFFGDGAVNTGSFHEGINFAAVWKLPVIFVCENNQFAVSTRVSEATGAQIASRGESYGIAHQAVDGMNVEDVYMAASEAVARAKRGDGPTLLECITYRYRGHGVYDIGLEYRTQEEIDKWMSQDPIARLETKLISGKIVSPKDLEDIRTKMKSRVEEAAKFALDSPYPSKELLNQYVWA
ncbi:MAG TPA: thiamine pyrophosphate-dependent dehydrogenase E1 component subunit alpha [Candidatus Bathyarchaeia archaeon]|nr:thiamine pyrophosphate-dependent dehydrogenase E1 component subunit alpha [Candidatus Bathyarchaeia archaeon]